MAGLALTPLKAASRTRVELDDIDPVVVETVEEAWEYFQTPESAGTRLATPDLEGGKEAGEAFLKQMRSYAYHRKDVEGKGRLVVAGNSNKEGSVRFMLGAYVE